MSIAAVVGSLQKPRGEKCGLRLAVYPPHILYRVS